MSKPSNPSTSSTSSKPVETKDNASALLDEDELPPPMPELARTRSVLERMSELLGEGFTQDRIDNAFNAMGPDVPPFAQVDWCRKWMTAHPVLTAEEKAQRVDVVMSPGFTRQQSLDALKETKGNVQGALMLLIEKRKAEEDAQNAEDTAEEPTPTSTSTSSSTSTAGAKAPEEEKAMPLIGVGLTGEARQDFFLEQFTKVCQLIRDYEEAQKQKKEFKLADSFYPTQVIEFLYQDAAKEAQQLRANVEKERKRLAELADVIGDDGKWEWRGPNGFLSYETSVAKQLESAYRICVKTQAPTEVRFTASANGANYTVSITSPTSIVQKNDQTGNPTLVRRTVVGGKKAGTSNLDGTGYDSSASSTFTTSSSPSSSSSSSSPYSTIVSTGFGAYLAKTHKTFNKRQSKRGSGSFSSDSSSSSSDSTTGATESKDSSSSKSSSPVESTEAKAPEVVKHTECQVCYCDFNDTDTLAVCASECGHRTICTGCFQTYVETKVNDSDVLPYIRCPEVDCKMHIAAADLRKASLTLEVQLQLAKVHMMKTITRNPDWVQCKTARCPLGFLHRVESGVKATKVCPLCNTKQVVVKSSVQLDADFVKMKKEGHIRDCPKCSYPAMKEYGLCNIMQCGKCGIYWNWASRETAPDSNTLKQIARNKGTLWEAGELSYQQQLQQNDPAAFKALLERNGIKYDPNYQRGT